MVHPLLKLLHVKYGPNSAILISQRGNFGHGIIEFGHGKVME